MKRLMLLQLAALFCGMTLLSGCASSYVMTLHNGSRITTASKPKLQQGRYIYKDARGDLNYVPEGRVRQIEPASTAKEEKPRFNPSS